MAIIWTGLRDALLVSANALGKTEDGLWHNKLDRTRVNSSTGLLSK